MTGSQIVMAVLAIGLASAAQGLTGFGFSVVGVPLLLLVFDPPTVVVLSLVLSLVLSASLLPSAPGRVDVRANWPLFATSFVGAIGAGLLLPHVSGSWLRPAMGFAAFAGGLAVVFGKGQPPFRREKVALAVTGFISGVMNGFASLSGPAIATLALRQRWPADRARRTMLAYSLFVNAVALAALLAGGMLTLPRILLAAQLLPVVFAGRIVGQHGSRRIPAHAFRIVTLLMVLFCGATAMSQGIAATLH